MALYPEDGTTPCAQCNHALSYSIEGMVYWGDLREKEAVHCIICDDCGSISTIKRTYEEAVQDWNMT